MNGLPSLLTRGDRLRVLNVLALSGWALGLLLFPVTLDNPGYAGMTFLPAQFWGLLFAVVALGLGLSLPGRYRALFGTFAVVLWGMVALSILYPLLLHGPAVGSLPGVLIYSLLALSATLTTLDGAK